MKMETLRKWLVSAAVTALMAAVSVPVSAAAEWRKVDRMGDLNGDGEVNVADIVTLSKHLHGTAKLGDKSIYSIGRDHYAIGSVENKDKRKKK